MRSDFGTDAVLERGDDLPAGGVVLGIRAEHQQHVEAEPDRVALDLDVALLKDVEQADLHLARQIGQLVDGEHAAVRARQQAVMHRHLVAELAGAPGRLDRIDVSDHVRNRDIRCRELLDVAIVARPPHHGQIVAF